MLVPATASQFHIGCADMSLHRNFVIAHSSPINLICLVIRCAAPCGARATRCGGADGCGSAEQQAYPPRMLRNAVSGLPLRKINLQRFPLEVPIGRVIDQAELFRHAHGFHTAADTQGLIHRRHVDFDRSFGKTNCLGDFLVG